MVELFTSEGCSICPPADEVLARLAERQLVPGVEIIALSEHVDYWNRLGWADPFSDARFSDRQQDYARAFAKTAVYTPQTVVDGRIEFVGSNIDRAVEAASRAGREAKTPIELARIAGTPESVTLEIRVARPSALGPGESADLYLAVTENRLSSDVARGENRGRRLIHAAVVRHMRIIGRVTGSGPFAVRTVAPIARGWKPADLRAVVFAQARNTRHVLGVSSIALQP